MSTFDPTNFGRANLDPSRKTDPPELSHPSADLPHVPSVTVKVPKAELFYQIGNILKEGGAEITFTSRKQDVLIVAGLNDETRDKLKRLGATIHDDFKADPCTQKKPA